jgi:hypothetical protein
VELRVPAAKAYSAAQTGSSPGPRFAGKA